MPTSEARLAGESDLTGVMALYRELRPADPDLTEATRRARWRKVTDGEHSIVAVVCVDGEIAATAMLALVANLASGGRSIGLIEHVVTASRFRRRGLARELLRFTLEQAWAANCCKVLLLSGSQRADAHRVYEAAGFSGDVERGFVIKSPDDPATPLRHPKSNVPPA